MLRKISLLLITFILITAATIVAGADDESGITVYTNDIVTTDLDTTFIEGEVPVADGQEIVIQHGVHIIASKAMPKTGAPASFRIKVPAEYLDADAPVSLRVRATAGSKVSESLPAKVEITYKPRETQTVKTGSSEYNLTLPGIKESLDTETTSGSDVMYISNNPDVVSVDEEGTLIPVGQGEAEISVKALGNSRYDGAETSVDVKVDEIDAYSVTFHSSIKGEEEEQTDEQIINVGESTSLESVPFECSEHQFLGWATEEGGLVEYNNEATVTDLAAKGENQDLYAVWTGDGARAAVAWAIQIANDDSFNYGDKPEANAIGCYFCGTNCGPVKYNKPSGYEKTYVCLTFVGAAYAHGAEDPEIYYADRRGKMPLYLNDDNFSKFSCWEKIGRCCDLTLDDLKPGDVLIQWSDYNDNDGHACMYAGNGDIVESSGGGWSSNSIGLKKGEAAGRLSSYGGDSINYVMRYVGPNAED